MNSFAEYQLDVLKEVGNIGAGHAATALSRLLNKQIDMHIPNVKLVSFEEVAESVGGAENIVIAIYLRVEGAAPGNIFFILTQDSAQNLLRNLVGIVNENQDSYSELELSALSEIGNILAGSYLSSLSDLTNLYMTPTVPSLAIDMAGAILSYGLIQFGHMGDNALLIDAKLLEGKDEVEGHFLFIPDPESFHIIFNALGVPFE